jgi:hypothetical protein
MNRTAPTTDGRALRALALLVLAALGLQLQATAFHPAATARADLTVHALDGGQASQSHDGADCAICRAIANARTALRGAAMDRASPPPRRPALVALQPTELRGSLSHSTITPRGPPA